MTTPADPAAVIAIYGVHRLRAYSTPTGGTHWYVDTTDDDAPAINYDPDDADMFAVDPNGRIPDDNHDVYEQARAMMVAVEAAILFRSVVRHRYTRPEASRDRAADIDAAEQDDTP